MTKIVTLTDLKVTYMHIDYMRQCVNVSFVLVDDQGTPWEKDQATFWVDMPAEPTDHDFLLKAEYIPTLISLRDDADTALSNKFLV